MTFGPPKLVGWHKWVAIGTICGGFGAATPLALAAVRGAISTGTDVASIPGVRAVVQRHELRLTAVEARVSDCEAQRQADTAERREVLRLLRKALAERRR